jgi:ligand-binding sensor domain-containing protein/two-component sensor histidine kinase
MRRYCRITFPRVRASICQFLLLLGLALSEGLYGAETNALGHFSVRIWQADDGLPQNSVFALAQTTNGYVWVGTHDGLARFDGIRFTIFDDKAAPQLRHGWIRALCGDREGGLWIGCEGAGLFYLREGKLISHFEEADGLPSNLIRCFAFGNDGTLWIGTEGGVSQFKAGHFKNFYEKDGLADNSVKALSVTSDGGVRIATRRGLCTLTAAGTISTMNFGIGTVANALKGVCEDAAGNIWVTSNDGVICVTPTNRVAFGLGEGLPDKLCTMIAPDTAGRVWVGTYSGVACIANGTVIGKPMNTAGFGDLVYVMFQDQEENLWVGARDGLYMLRPTRFTTYTMQEGLNCNNVMSVCEDRNGTVWLGTWGGGINRIGSKGIEFCRAGSGLTHDSVLSLYEGRDGAMWVGMDFDGGVNHLTQGCQNSFERQNGLINAAVLAVHEDRQGTVWIGTARGLNVYRNGKFNTYTTSRGLAGNMVLAIFEDSKGECWLGTDGGLSLWSKGKFVNFTTRNGLPHNVIGAIYEDGEGTLWLGSRGAGLVRYREGKFTAYGSKAGLFSDEIFEILEDDFGYFWMSCRAGIFRVAKKEFAALDRGEIKTLTSIAFGKADGLVSIQCNGTSKPSGWKSRNGQLWFPTIRGAVAVDSRIKTNDKPPPVTIEQVSVNGLSLTNGNNSLGWFGKSVRVQPGRGELRVQFSALSFQSPEKNRFKYILEGADTDWVDAGTRREAYYNNLAPGPYKLRVVACNNDGLWNSTGTMFSVIFLPHYWQTWWFKASLPLVFALFLTAWYRFRVARLRGLERLRVQIAADLHDDVGSRLTQAAMITESINRETPETDRNKSHITVLAKTTREIIQAMDEIVWTINPKNDTLDNLANYIFQYAQEFYQTTGVRCRMDMPAKLPDRHLPTEQRHNLFMAVKEAMNNVVKHSGATEASVSLSVSEARLMISVADNGKGFDLEAPRVTGEGLRNMKERLQTIGGTLRIESAAGQGTKIEMESSLG